MNLLKEGQILKDCLKTIIMNEEEIEALKERAAKPFVTPRFGDTWKEHAKKNYDINDVINIAWTQGRIASLMEMELMKDIPDGFEQGFKRALKSSNRLIKDLFKMWQDMSEVGELTINHKYSQQYRDMKFRVEKQLLK